MNEPPHPTEVKAKLIRLFGSVSAFERAKQLAPQSVRDVLRGKTSRRTADAVAEAVGLSIEQLFPGRFTSDDDHKSQNRDLHPQTVEAA